MLLLLLSLLWCNVVAAAAAAAIVMSSAGAAAAGRNFIRGALLGVGATFLGVLLFGAPEYLGGSLKALNLPPALTAPGFIVSMKIAGAAIW
jgi:uncharacterized membrane protein YgaE (UPF0421/DUF939 family)